MKTASGMSSQCSTALLRVIDVSGGSPSVVKRLLLDLPKMVFEVNLKDVVTEAVSQWHMEGRSC